MGIFSQYLLPADQREIYRESKGYGQNNYTPVVALNYAMLGIAILIPLVVLFPLTSLAIVVLCGILYGMLQVARKAYKLSGLLKKHETNSNTHRQEKE